MTPSLKCPPLRHLIPSPNGPCPVFRLRQWRKSLFLYSFQNRACGVKIAQLIKTTRAGMTFQLGEGRAPSHPLRPGGRREELRTLS
jgi:hypothetical protein